MRKAEIISLLIILAIIAGCSSAKKTEKQISEMQTAQAHMRIGMRFLDNRDYGQALKELNLAYEAIKNDPLLINSIGLAYKGLRDYKTAEEYFKVALDLEPGFFDTHNNLGVLYAETGKYDEAKYHFIEVLKNKSYTTPELAHYNLALIFIRENKQDLAISELKKAIEKAPDFLYSYLQLGLLYKDTDRLEDAIEIFEKALAIQPDIPQFTYNIGLIYEMKHDIPAAVSNYKKALNNPECPEELSRVIRQKLINLEDIDSLIE